MNNKAVTQACGMMAGLAVLVLILSVTCQAQSPAAAVERQGNDDSASLFESPKTGTLEDKNRQLQEAEERLLNKLSKSEPAAPKEKPLAAKTEEVLPAVTLNGVSEKPAGTGEESPAKVEKKSAATLPAKPQSESIDDLKKKLAQKDDRIRDLQKELEEARNRLILAETEVERLSSQLDNRNRSSLSRMSAPAGQTQAVKKLPAEKAPAAAPRVENTAAEESDMQVATVIAEKAHLRLGPGENNSPIMDVTRGTRLTVETRKGNWLRVNTPTGTRAWISGDVVEFGSGKSSSALRIRGYDASVEEAFKLLDRSGTR